MAGGAEVTRLTGESEKDFVLAVCALDAGKGFFLSPRSRGTFRSPPGQCPVTRRICFDIARHRRTETRESAPRYTGTGEKTLTFLACR
jgi:hypothetical protein